MANPKSKRRRKVIILVVIVLALAGLGAFALTRKREPVIKVQKEKVTRRNLTEKVTANGRIQPVLQVKISAEVSGEIIELPVKEGQQVKKGDLLVRIKPDVYAAARRSSEASYQSALSGKALSEANLRKAELEFKRNEELYKANLIAESIYVEYQTALDVAKAQVDSASHQVDMAKASLSRAEEELAKTTIYSPLAGTVSKLNSELGERVVGTAMMSGTEIMIIADLNRMEARVDIGEIDIPLIALQQVASLEVDAFRDRRFKGAVSEIANSSKGAGMATGGQSQEGTKFEVRIEIQDKEAFRPGMTVTAEIETRYRTNVLTVPVQSVTTRPPKPPETKPGQGTNATQSASTSTNTPDTTATNDASATTSSTNASTNLTAPPDKAGRKGDDKPKHVEVVFVVNGDKVKMVPVKRGISDDTYTEIVEGLEEGQEVVSGGYKAISKELEDGKQIKIGEPEKTSSPSETTRP